MGKEIGYFGAFLDSLSYDDNGSNPQTSDTPAATQPPATAAKSPFPDMDGRPCYVVLDDWHRSDEGRIEPGVWYCGFASGKKDAPPEPINIWVCTPIHVKAFTFDSHDENFGRLLRFKNTKGNWGEWAMPMELLAGDGTALREVLMNKGVEIDYWKGRQHLNHYIQKQHTKKRMHCALQVGWCGNSYGPAA